MVRAGLCLLLREPGDVEIVGEAADGKVAVQLARQRVPDVVLMHISLPGLNGLVATRRIRQEVPSVSKFVVNVYLRARRGESGEASGTGINTLTTRQREVLQLLAEGKRNCRTRTSAALSSDRMGRTAGGQSQSCCASSHPWAGPASS